MINGRLNRYRKIQYLKWKCSRRWINNTVSLEKSLCLIMFTWEMIPRFTLVYQLFKCQNAWSIVEILSTKEVLRPPEQTNQQKWTKINIFWCFDWECLSWAHIFEGLVTREWNYLEGLQGLGVALCWSMCSLAGGSISKGHVRPSLSQPSNQDITSPAPMPACHHAPCHY